MELQFTSLGSGSRGNCTVVHHGRTTILVDCGFSRSRTIAKLHSRNLDPSDVTAILVTHEHSDHINGVRLFANYFNVPVFATLGTLSRLGDVEPSLVNEIAADDSIAIGDVQVQSISVPHDAREPTQFTFDCGSSRFGLLTDIGVITEQVIDRYSNCGSLFLESNHDTDMLWSGDDPQHLKVRVAGNGGHLSNAQARDFVDEVMHDGLSTLAIGHISQRNNSMRVLQREYADVANKLDVLFATQEEGTPWISVD